MVILRKQENAASVEKNTQTMVIQPGAFEPLKKKTKHLVKINAAVRNVMKKLSMKREEKEWLQ